MELKIEKKNKEGKICVLALSGEMDIYTAPKLKEEIATVIKEGHSKIILELEGLKYIDSTGLGVLVSALTRAKKNGGTLCLVSPTRPVVRLLEIVGMNVILKSYASTEEALKGINEIPGN